MRCPMPLLLAKRALLQGSEGDVLTVLVSDPASWRDFHAFAQASGEQMTATQCQKTNLSIGLTASLAC
jgi:tRNA 2-thiouridine synthesizing protein A